MMSLACSFHAACFVMSAHEAVANMRQCVAHGETHTMGRYPALSKLETGTYRHIHKFILYKAYYIIHIVYFILT